MSIPQRLYPSSISTLMLVKHCSDARFVYNLGLGQRNLWRPERTHGITYITQARELTEVRRAYPWLAEGCSVVQQGALRDLDEAFQNWWGNPNHFHRLTWRKAVLNQLLHQGLIGQENKSQVGRGPGTQDRVGTLPLEPHLNRDRSLNPCSNASQC